MPPIRDTKRTASNQTKPLLSRPHPSSNDPKTVFERATPIKELRPPLHLVSDAMAASPARSSTEQIHAIVSCRQSPPTDQLHLPMTRRPPSDEEAQPASFPTAPPCEQHVEGAPTRSCRTERRVQPPGRITSRLAPPVEWPETTIQKDTQRPAVTRHTEKRRDSNRPTQTSDTRQSLGRYTAISATGPVLPPDTIARSAQFGHGWSTPSSLEK